MSRKHVTVTVVLAALAIVPAGCGGEAHTKTRAASTTAPVLAPITRAQAAQRYLRDIAPVNAALSALTREAAGWNASTTPKQAQTDAQPAVRALGALRVELRSLSSAYPPVGAEIAALQSAYAPFEGDLSRFRSTDAASTGALMLRASRDAAATKAASAAVRANLGLPEN